MSRHRSGMSKTWWIVYSPITFFSTRGKTSSKQEARASGKLRNRRSSRANSKVRPCSPLRLPLPDDFIILETKFALEFFKRRRALEERFRRARTKSGRARQSVRIYIRVLLTAHPSAQRPMTRHITSNDNCLTLNAQSIQHYLLSIAAQNPSWNALRVCNAWLRSRNEQITIPLLPPSMRITIAHIITPTPRPTGLP